MAELEYELKRLRAGRHGGQPPAAEHPAAEGVPVARRDEAPPPPVSARAHEVLEVLESYDPAVRDRLRAVIQEEQEVLRQQESEFRDERRDARTLRQIQELAEKADLTSADTDFLYGALTTERQEIRALFRTARIEGSYGEAHDKANEMRAKTDQAVAEKLNDEQYEAYQAMRDQQRGPWARRRRATKEATKN